MGKLLPGYKKAIIDEVTTAITSNTSQYYAYASNPIAFSGNTPATSAANQGIFDPMWRLLFGKKLANTDVVPVARKITWTSNTVYVRYDDDVELSNTSFYVITNPSILGGQYDIYKCIDNANGAPSTVQPDQVQQGSFTKSDGYTWRYICSISDNYNTKFATPAYVPIVANTTVVAGANGYNGVEVIKVANGGIGYSAYTNGTVQSVINSTCVQIDSSASGDNDFYTRNGIYLYNIAAATAQLKTVNGYVSNASGKFVTFTPAANGSSITSQVTKYLISPKVVFDTNGTVDPQGYSVINAVSNSIYGVVITDPGYGISWANVSIQSNTSYGSGASLLAITPPGGGHGSDPVTELDVQGLGVSFSFANTEGSTVPAAVLYNKIGLVKNPSALANTNKGTSFSSNTFSAVLKATVSPSTTFTAGHEVYGQSSAARGTVAFSNSSTIFLTGDKTFIDGETIVSAVNGTTAAITINTRGDIYSTDLMPFYVQNIDNVQRANNQTESFKIIVQV